MGEIRLFLSLLRVKQWTKNLLVFAALLFTLNLFNPAYFLKTLVGFFLFSFAASFVYILNDLLDYKEDRHHPEKKNRPIASGAVRRDFAFAAAIFLLFAALAGSFFLSIPFFILLLCYTAMMVFYSLKLKHFVIIDVFVISAGFVLRAVSGALILNVVISPWLLICSSLLALFLALAKRRYELNSLTEAHRHRKILEEYSIPMLDEMISVVTASTLIAYSLYTFTSKTAQSHDLMLTIPFVMYGIFRYLYLIHRKNLGGSPEVILLKDKPLVINIALWVSSIVIIVYFLK